MILILKTGHTNKNIKAAHGDYEDWIARSMELSLSEYHVHYTENYNDLPPTHDYKGIVITGSPLMVTDINLKKARMRQWLLDHQYNETPILGICFGHQLLNVINGGTVKNNTTRTNVGTSSSCLSKAGKNDKLTSILPETFEMHRYHRQSVFELPEKATILSTDSMGIIDVIRFAANTWGVQSHPEFDSKIMRMYILERREALLSEGIEIEELLNKVSKIDFGEKILKQFYSIVNG